LWRSETTNIQKLETKSGTSFLKEFMKIAPLRTRNSAIREALTNAVLWYSPNDGVALHIGRFEKAGGGSEAPRKVNSGFRLCPTLYHK
jgi:hypothetical protein